MLFLHPRAKVMVLEISVATSKPEGDSLSSPEWTHSIHEVEDLKSLQREAFMFLSPFFHRGDNHQHSWLSPYPPKRVWKNTPSLLWTHLLIPTQGKRGRLSGPLVHIS